jgi:hypothetical protein
MDCQAMGRTVRIIHHVQWQYPNEKYQSMRLLMRSNSPVSVQIPQVATTSTQPIEMSETQVHKMSFSFAKMSRYSYGSGSIDSHHLIVSRFPLHLQ